MCSRFVDAGILFVGEKFEVLNFIEVVFSSYVTKPHTADYLGFVCFYQGGDNVADIHGVIFGIVFVLLVRLAGRDIVIFFALRLVDQRTLLSLLTVFFLLRKLWISICLDFEQVVERSDLVVSVVD